MRTKKTPAKPAKSRKVEVKDLDARKNPTGGPNGSSSWSPSYLGSGTVQPELNPIEPKR
jgi:hypothetical protein